MTHVSATTLMPSDGAVATRAWMVVAVPSMLATAVKIAKLEKVILLSIATLPFCTVVLGLLTDCISAADTQSNDVHPAGMW